MAAVKVRIDASQGIFEMEGEEQFVSTQLEKILPLLQRVSLRSKTSQDEERVATEGQGGDETEVDRPLEKKKKRRGAPTPKGSGCRDRILTLKADGFFKEQRSPSDIVGGLKKKGWTYKINQVGAALTTMFNKGEVQRTEQDGKFKYFWDR